MKKLIALLLTLTLCLSLCACGITDIAGGIIGGGSSSKGVLGKDIEGNVCIKPKKFGSLMEKVVLTPENWQDYISVVSYDKTTVERDVFGEVTDQTTETVYLLGANTDRYHAFDFNHTAIELKNKQTGETKIYKFNYYGRTVDENFDLNDYECTRVQGNLYYLDLPEEVIQQSQYQKDCGKGSFSVGDSSFNWIISLDVDAKVVEMMEYDFENYLND